MATKGSSKLYAISDLWSGLEDIRDQVNQQSIRLFRLLQLESSNLLAPLVLKLLEYYNCDLNTFIFNGHSFAITLEDIMYITGLPIQGIPIMDASKDKNAFSIFDKNFCKSSCPISKLKDHAKDTRVDPITRMKAALLVLIACFVIPTGDEHRINRNFVKYVDKLDEVDNYAWGAALLAFLHDGISKWKKEQKSLINGNLWVVLSVFLIRIRSLREAIHIKLDLENAEVPLLHSVLNAVKNISHNHKPNFLDKVKEALDTLSEEEINWVPYKHLKLRLPDILKEQEKYKLLLSPICCMNSIVHHRPHLAAKQFEELKHLDLSKLTWLETDPVLKQIRDARKLVTDFLPGYQEEGLSRHNEETSISRDVDALEYDTNMQIIHSPRQNGANEATSQPSDAAFACENAHHSIPEESRCIKFNKRCRERKEKKNMPVVDNKEKKFTSVYKRRRKSNVEKEKKNMLVVDNKEKKIMSSKENEGAQEAMRQENNEDKDEGEKNITDGKPFLCPIHFCCVCKGLENKMEPDLQLAVCNRCPKSYHRKCLPIGIAFDGDGVQTRAWEGLLPNNRILIYCLNHKIIDKLGTPVRDHIKFPDTRAAVPEINTNKRMKPTTKDRVILKNDVGVVKSSGKSTAEGSNVTGKLPSSKIGCKKSAEKIISGSDISKTPEAKVMSSKCLTENKKSISKNSSEKVISSDISRKLESNKSCLTESKKSISKNSSEKVISSDISRKLESSKSCLTESKKSISKLSGKMTSGSDISREPKSNEISGRLSTENKKSISKKFEKPKCASTSKSSEQIKHDNQVDDADNQTLSIKPIRSVFPPHDADSEKGLVDSFKEARSSILLEGVTEKHKLDDSVDLTTKLDKVISHEHGNCGDKLMLNHVLLVSTDDQEEQACINESRKRSSHHANVDQESEKRQEFKMSKSWKTSGRRKLIENNDRKGLGVSSQLFKSVVSPARRCIKHAPGHQGRSHSEIEKGTSVKNADENQNREEDKHRRESNARQQVGPSGVQDSNSTQNDHLSGHNPSCANKHPQLSTTSKSLNKMNTLAADESNLVRTGSPTPDPPIFSGNGTFERIVLPGFAAGPNFAFSLHHSAGWLEED